MAKGPSSSKRTDPLTCIGYRTVGPIAAGAFSTVVRARRVGGRSEPEVAVKSFPSSKYKKPGWLKNALKNEIDVLLLLQPSGHAHVANLIELHDEGMRGLFCTHAVLEYCSGGSVTRHLRSLGHSTGLSEPHGSALVEQLAIALAHLHDLGIAHRDVKAENVLYTDSRREQIKLCDYGFAVICGSRKLRSVCGSPAYMAPEINAKLAHYGPPLDCWALGCFAFEVLHGCAPFTAPSLETLHLRIKRVDHAAFNKKLSSEVKRLIMVLWVVNPDDRCNAAEAVRLWHAARTRHAAPAAAPQPPADERMPMEGQHDEI